MYNGAGGFRGRKLQEFGERRTERRTNSEEQQQLRSKEDKPVDAREKEMGRRGRKGRRGNAYESEEITTKAD